VKHSPTSAGFLEINLALNENFAKSGSRAPPKHNLTFCDIPILGPPSVFFMFGIWNRFQVLIGTRMRFAILPIAALLRSFSVVPWDSFASCVHVQPTAASHNRDPTEVAMPLGPASERRREERQTAVGTLVLFLDDRDVNMVAEIKDLSACGFGVRQGSPGSKAGRVLRVSHNHEEKRVRVVWTQDKGECSTLGLLNEEVYLIDRLRAGDTESFSRLVSPHMRSLRWTIRAILNNQADVEEVVQESLLKAMLHLDQFHLGQSFKSWLLKIGSNEALKRIRRDRKHRAPSGHTHKEGSREDELLEQLIEQLVDPRESPAAVLERKEFLQAVYAGMNSLDDIYRQVFLLRDLQHLAMPQVAGLLGISIETANTRLHRARLQMREQLRHKVVSAARPSPPASDQARNGIRKRK
jgi:RNA polymerase sigma-70 factor, ECF subfamily